MPHQTNETLRKIIHIAFGLCAFGLKWLPWQAAALVAAAAVVGNWLLLHRVVGKSVARDARGYDVGILLYPLVVLLLIVIFRQRIEVAGVAWAILAFGDGFATLAGKSIGGPRLPWNRQKSWSGLLAFIAFGFAGANAVDAWLATRSTVLPGVAILAVVVIVAAIVESLPLNVDDNLTVPAAAALTMAPLLAAVALPVASLDRFAVTWLIVNTLLAVAGYAARSVDLSGAAGGWILGAVLIVFGGWPLYSALLAFFVIGTATTKLGYRRKAALGLAQERGGRRGFSHAFSNVGVAAILALLIPMLDPLRYSWQAGGALTLWMAAAAALATATADTTASEIGQLLGRRTFLPLTFRPVPRGTEGAISLEGTLAGLVAGALVATLAVLAHFHELPDVSGKSAFELRWIALLTGCAFIGSYIESIAGSWNRKREQPVPNGALNFFNTLCGALLVIALAPNLPMR
jgi:uncharacterized protein (TIGR00297 family)